MSLAAIVQHYTTFYRPSSERELEWFRQMPSLEAAIEKAAFAINSSGLRFPHQRRIKQAPMNEVRKRLLASRSDLAEAENFAGLYNTLGKLLNPVAGVGELYHYDLSLRLGAKLGYIPAAVYMHAGTRSGAISLGLGGSNRIIMKSELPSELRVLPYHEIEDVLCIYKSVLADAKSGRPVDLPENDRCYLDDAEDAS